MKRQNRKLWPPEIEGLLGSPVRAILALNRIMQVNDAPHAIDAGQLSLPRCADYETMDLQGYRWFVIWIT